jgi:hypothetical protein
MDGGTLESVGDGLGLDPGGLLPPHEVARLHQLLADAELRERRRQGRRRLLLLAGIHDQIVLRHGFGSRD